MSKKSTKLFVCTRGKKCPKRGGEEVFTALQDGVKAQGLDVEVIGSKCLGLCKKGPSVVVMPAKEKLTRVDPEDATDLLAEHCGGAASESGKKKKKKKKDKED
jgi:Ferredoxin